jgi:uncharacterized membrane protein YbhN (UPF0104 family)
VEHALAEALPVRRAHLASLARRALKILPPILLVAAGAVLWREFHHLGVHEIAHAMAAWGPGALASAVAFSAASFFLMGVIEWVGLRWTGAQVPWWRAQGGSFMANGIAHALGANLLVSGAIRARLYARHGVSLIQAAGATLFAGMTFAVGISALSGCGLLLADPADLAATAMPVSAARGLGAGLIAFVATYLVLCVTRRRPFTAFGRSLRLPTGRDALVQLLAGVVDNGLAAAILWVLLPPGSVAYATFVGAYAVACVAGLASSVPGGVGVFEGALATLLPAIGKAPLAAAFVGFRLVYYLGPLILASLALAADTIRTRRP